MLLRLVYILSDPDTVTPENGDENSDINFKYNFDNDKPLMKNNTYSEADWLKLEEILKQHVDAAGRGTKSWCRCCRKVPCGR